MLLGLHLPFFSLQRKWEGVESFFGIVALGSRKPFFAQDWYVCQRYWISAKRAPSKPHQCCLTLATTCLDKLLLGFVLEGDDIQSNGSCMDGRKLFLFNVF